MSIEMNLWVVNWRRGKIAAWRVNDDGQYAVNKPRQYSDSDGAYWQVPVYAHNKMTAIFDAAAIINKRLSDENIR